MVAVDPFIAEDLADLIRCDPCRRRSVFSEDFQRDPQEHLLIKGIEFGDEGARFGSAVDALKTGVSTSMKLSFVEVIADHAEEYGCGCGKVADFRIGDQIEPAFAVAQFFIGQASMFISKGKEGFAKERELF